MKKHERNNVVGCCCLRYYPEKGGNWFRLDNRKILPCVL